MKVSIINRNIENHDQIVLLEKTKLNNADRFLKQALINSNISHDEFVLINIVLKEYDNVKKEIKNPNIIKWILIVLNVLCLQKTRNIQIKRKISWKINIYFHCTDCGFKMFASIDEVELIYLLRGLNYLYSIYYLLIV